MIGLVLVSFYGSRWVRWRDGALEIGCRRIVPAWAVAQTYGGLVFYRCAEEDARVRAHEHRHVRQAMVLGALLLPLYGLASVWAWARGGHYYRDNWFERAARGD